MSTPIAQVFELLANYETLSGDEKKDIEEELGEVRFQIASAIATHAKTRQLTAAQISELTDHFKARAEALSGKNSPFSTVEVAAGFSKLVDSGRVEPDATADAALQGIVDLATARRLEGATPLSSATTMVSALEGNQSAADQLRVTFSDLNDRQASADEINASLQQNWPGRADAWSRTRSAKKKAGAGFIDSFMQNPGGFFPELVLGATGLDSMLDGVGLDRTFRRAVFNPYDPRALFDAAVSPAVEVADSIGELIEEPPLEAPSKGWQRGIGDWSKVKKKTSPQTKVPEPAPEPVPEPTPQPVERSVPDQAPEESPEPVAAPSPRLIPRPVDVAQYRKETMQGLGSMAGGVTGSVLQGFASGGATGILAMITASEGFAQVMKPVNELMQKTANVVGAFLEPFAALFEDLSKALTPTLEALRPIVATLMELSPWFQLLKFQVQLLGEVMQGVAGFLTDGVLAFLQFLKKALNGMGISWKSLDKAIAALKNPVDALSKAFAAITSNIPNDYDLLNLRIFQVGGLRAAGEEVSQFGQEAIDRLVEALHQLTDPIETVAVWLEKLVKKIKKLIDKLDGGGDGFFGIGSGATSSGDSVPGPAQARSSGTVIYGGVHVVGVTDPESFFRKLEGVRTRHETLRNGSPRYERRRR